jgi:23S rRNA G2445 N2-methylase RlmL
MSGEAGGKRTGPVMVATCHYGLEKVLEHEIKERLGVPSARSWCECAFGFGGEPERLAGLGVAQDVLLEVDRFEIEPGSGLPESRLREVPLGAWLSAYRAAQPPPEGAEVRLTVSRHGEHGFSYRDVARVVEESVRAELGLGVTEGHSPLELRVEVKGEHVRVLGRVFERPVSYRSWLGRHFEGMTDPTVARAMALLSRPVKAEKVLDPFCGCGVIPIERHFALPSVRLTAGDIRPRRLEEARVNLANAGVECRLEELDAFRLPFEDRSFTAVLTHPPQSDPETGRPWKGRRYRALIEELLRVLEYSGRLVLFGASARRVNDAVEANPKCQPRKKLTCEIGGRKRHMHILEKSLEL